MLFLEWYAISLAIVGVLAAITQARSKLLAFYHFCQHYYLHYIAYRLLVKRRYFMSVTCLQGVLFATFLGVHGFLLGYQHRGLSDISNRCGVLCSTNMVPLFFVGRSRLADFLGIPIHVQRLTHHWMGRTSAGLALAHGVMALVSRTDPQNLKPSGLMTLIAIGGATLFSVYGIRQRMYEIFQGAHMIFASAAIAGLVWHLRSSSWSVLCLPIISATLWSCELIPMIWRSRIKSKGGTVTPFYRTKMVGGRLIQELDVIRVELPLINTEEIKPGQFIYLRMRNYYFADQIQAHPFMVSWWDEASYAINDNRKPRNVREDEAGDNLKPSQGREDEEVVRIEQRRDKPREPKAEVFTLLIQPANGFTRRLADQRYLCNVSFDGPYGQDLHLGEYHNVFLAAKGIGIAGVLSYAKDLLMRKTNPKLKLEVITKKVDLYWQLDDNCQEDWAGKFLKEIQLRNKKTQFVQVWCYFPARQTTTPVVEVGIERRDFRYFYPDSKPYMKMEDALSTSGQSTGRSIVVACGVSDFTNSIRQHTRSVSSGKHVVEFAEAEYRPWNSSAGMEQSEGTRAKHGVISRQLRNTLYNRR